tara:strand:+ start:962 stop:1186 length:225 start_codon:yes stop_codon:yes gene_type:complete
LQFDILALSADTGNYLVKGNKIMTNQSKEHPEVEEIKEICEVTPDSDAAKDVCKTIKKERPDMVEDEKNQSSSQ